MKNTKSCPLTYEQRLKMKHDMLLHLYHKQGAIEQLSCPICAALYNYIHYRKYPETWPLELEETK